MHRLRYDSPHALYAGDWPNHERRAVDAALACTEAGGLETGDGTSGEDGTPPWVCVRGWVDSRPTYLATRRGSRHRVEGATVRELVRRLHTLQPRVQRA